MTRTRITPTSNQGESGTWEDQYLAALKARGAVSPAGLREIQRCTDSAFEFIGHIGRGHSPEFVAGAIVGAVQSGKTSLMINLAARALDHGFRCIVVLAGLRDDLRMQTAIRFNRDLLWKGDRLPEGLGGGLTHPNGLGYHGARRECWSPAVGDDVNHDEAFAHLMAARLRRGHAVLAVAKKNVTTLNHLSSALEYAVEQAQGRPIPILVIDDECDEASVSADPDAPTPDRIAEVWQGLRQRVAYIGFTATPAANLLQDPSATLFPGEFVLTMRAPGDSEGNLSYFEANPDRRYTGGYTYYQLLNDRHHPNFFLNLDMSEEEFQGLPGYDQALEEALLAYFVSGGIRLAEQGMPAFDNPDALPLPHTMLAHTESTIASHWELCQRIVDLVKRKAGRPAENRINIAKVPPHRRVQLEDLRAWLDAEPERWHRWYEDFKRSRAALLEVTPDRLRDQIPSWDEVREALIHVFGAVKLRVVNSDDWSVDDALQFEPTYTSAGPQPPRDIYSIIIGGNRLSRGLTIEGLCISYYTRMAMKLVEDTTVQRERWFGYRGSHLEFCRIFTHRSLAILLRRFHQHDEDIRRQLAWNVAHGRSPVDATFRFLTAGSIPTSKLGRGRGPLRLDVSGNRLFIDRVQMGDSAVERYAAERNQSHAFNLATQIHADGHPIIHDGNVLGYVLEGVPATYIANLLDDFCYTLHNPDPTRGLAWSLKDYYRAPDPNLPTTEYSFPHSSDPYIVAAFLRLWRAAYEECTRDSRRKGRYRAPDGVSDWTPCPPPTFNLAIRYGSMTPHELSPFSFKLVDRVVDSEGRVGSRWGGRRGGVGDEWIDLDPPNSDPDAPRTSDMPGLVLVHVIARQAVGRERQGVPYDYDRPCVGIVIPEGGPCHEIVIAEAP